MYSYIPSCKAGTEGNTDGKVGCVDIVVVVEENSTVGGRRRTALGDGIQSLPDDRLPPRVSHTMMGS